jgi:hypothetical protein
MHSIQRSPLHATDILQSLTRTMQGVEAAKRFEAEAIRLARKVCIRLCQLVIQNRHRKPSEVAELLRSVFEAHAHLRRTPEVAAIVRLAKSNLHTHLRAWLSILNHCGEVEGSDSFLDEILLAAALTELQRARERRAKSRFHSLGMIAKPKF